MTDHLGAREEGGKPEPKAFHCDACDPFFPGYRGGQRCVRCDGTGSVFRVPTGKPEGWLSLPNTEEGYHAAVKALQESTRP